MLNTPDSLDLRGFYPAVHFHVDGADVAVGSADVDELDQRPNADSLQAREQSAAQ